MATEAQIERADAHLTTRAAEPTRSLRSRILNSLSWEVGGQFAMTLWRFLGNVVLTRLVVPEAFAVIGLAQVFVLGLTMLSDMGLSASVIHHKRGTEPRFLDTVWTVEILRGALIWGITFFAAYPAAAFYEMPEIRWVLPTIGFAVFVRSFGSATVHVAKRELRNHWIVRIDCASGMLGTLVTVICAYFLRSVTALAIGWIVSSATYVVLSYCVKGIRFNRLAWDPEAASSLLNFGRWVIASSAVQFIRNQGDRLALAKVISANHLGNYVVGANLALVPLTVFHRIQQAVVLPVYARILDDPEDVFRSKILRLRSGIVFSVGGLLALIAIFAKPFVNVIYDEGYALAGWYCQMAAIAALTSASTDMGPIFMACGEPKRHFRLVVIRTTCTVFAMWLGYVIGAHFGDPGNGLLYGVVMGPVLAYPINAMMYRRINAWVPSVDLVGLSVAAGLVFAQAVHWI